MIQLIGTSHISSESVEDVPKKIQQYDPDVIAVELDPIRYQNLLTNQKQNYSLNKPVLSLIQYIQNKLSERTGITPGEELLTATEEAKKRNIPLALIDQDIRITMRQIKQINILEKIKLGGFLLLGTLLPFKKQEFDLDTVPSDELIQKLLIRLKISFPSVYNVLIDERNGVMASRLQSLEDEYGDVLAFVGAGHVHGIQQRLEDNTY